jgi:hypothetical protein
MYCIFVYRNGSANVIRCEVCGEEMILNQHDLDATLGDLTKVHRPCVASNYNYTIAAPAAESTFVRNAPVWGVGRELQIIFESLGIVPTATCPCHYDMREWTYRGTDWCERNIDLIVEKLRAGQYAYPVTTRAYATLKAVTTGLAFQISWSNPFPDIVREAISRSRAKGF